jgi:hypothetical protein
MTHIAIVAKGLAIEAEAEVNRIIKENEEQGFVVQVLNLTAQNINANIPWRFVLLFTSNPETDIMPPSVI